MKPDKYQANSTPLPMSQEKQYNPNAPDWVAPTRDIPEFVPSNFGNLESVSSYSSCCLYHCPKSGNTCSLALGSVVYGLAKALYPTCISLDM